ncbi:MAG: tetraacyldisaccharide 4'-kinase [Desulfatitalea sp.]|nr:tetraacyldisaccharide 4'-kinase [Desulfatitalea sp.]
MIHLRQLIETRVRAIVEGHDRGRWPLTRAALTPAAVAYGALMRLRVRLYERGWLKRRRLPCIVIAVGNLTAGGTGKTPMTMFVAEGVRRLGYPVAVISRGYKGALEHSVAVVSDGRKIQLSPAAAGDEPVMMALRLEGVPVVVGRDRVATGMLAIRRFQPRVIVCDDAFQHLRLVRDMDLVLLDHCHPLGNGWMLPRGMLREPASALGRADALVLTRCDRPCGTAGMALPQAFTSEKPVFRTRHDPFVCRVVAGEKGALPGAPVGLDGVGMEWVAGRTVFAFSGIARNRDFRESLQQAGCTVAGHAEFADHHAFSEVELSQIFRQAAEVEAEVMVTTEKDYVRIAHHETWPLDLVVIGIRMVFMEKGAGFEKYLRERLSALTG